MSVWGIWWWGVRLYPTSHGEQQAMRMLAGAVHTAAFCLNFLLLLCVECAFSHTFRALSHTFIQVSIHLKKHKIQIYNDL